MNKLSTFLCLLLTTLLLSCGSSDNKDENTEEEIPVEESQPNETALVSEEITYSADSVDMKGYLAYKNGNDEKVPGILVVHEWWGHNDYARKRTDMLAELGYVAIAVDMYGDGKTASHPNDAGKFSGMVMQNIDGAKARFVAAMEALKSNPKVDSNRIAAIGYCFGGSVALSMANLGLDLDAVAAFHSGVQLPVQPQQGGVKAKILVCNGADDGFIAEGSAEAYQKAMEEAGAEVEYISYEGAKHSFTSPEADSLGNAFSLPLAYNEKADNDSWAKLQALLNSVFNQ